MGLTTAELKALLEKRAELMCKKYGPDFENDFLAGAESTHDIICELVQALEAYTNPEWPETIAQQTLEKLRTELGEA